MRRKVGVTPFETVRQGLCQKSNDIALEFCEKQKCLLTALQLAKSLGGSFGSAERRAKMYTFCTTECVEEPEFRSETSKKLKKKIVFHL